MHPTVYFPHTAEYQVLFSVLVSLCFLLFGECLLVINVEAHAAHRRMENAAILTIIITSYQSQAVFSSLLAWPLQCASRSLTYTG